MAYIKKEEATLMLKLFDTPLPLLRHICNYRQIFELVLGALTFLPFGIGLIFFLVFFLDFSVISKIYTVKDKSTGKFLKMTREEFKNHQALVRERYLQKHTFNKFIL